MQDVGRERDLRRADGTEQGTDQGEALGTSEVMQDVGRGAWPDDVRRARCSGVLSALATCPTGSPGGDEALGPPRLVLDTTWHCRGSCARLASPGSGGIKWCLVTFGMAGVPVHSQSNQSRWH